MFLKKITALKGIGRFGTCAVSGGEYARYTLFYGGNGRGKTTLCAVLRSLQRSDASYVTVRRAFGYAGPQQAQVLLDTGPVSFGAGGWSGGAPDIHIFDQDFVAENVHAGQQIGVDQRRAFYRIAVGPKGVELTVAVDALDAASSEAQSAISAEARVLQQHVPQDSTLDAFLALEAVENCEVAIGLAQTAHKAAANAAEIAAKPLLKSVALPGLPAEFADLLAKGLAGVSSDASTRVAAQLAKHDFHDDGEAWLQTGVEHAAGGDCPFCGRALDGLDLVKVYEGYFSDAYGAHKLSVDQLKAATAQALGEAAALRCVQAFNEAGTLAQFWREYGVEGYTDAPEIDDVVTALNSLAKEARALIDAKTAAPLDHVALSPAFEDAFGRWSEISTALSDANEAMVAANMRIQEVKDATEIADPKIAKAVLNALLAMQKRHSEPVASLATKYAELLETKADLVSQKAARKAELDAYDMEMLGGYQKAINAILTRFDAGFRLAKCSKNYMGGTPQSAYCLQFGDTDVDICKVGGSGPTFATTMSAGDKNTFALAFFLAQLERDDNLAQKLVVFDDPFTSLDDFRREMTAKAIVRVGEKAAQVIVLSHDKYFLDAVRRKIHGAPWASKQISMTQSNSALEDWDIEWEVKEGYLQDHMELSDFADGIEGDVKDMRTKMRPLLEKYIRYRFPNQIAEGDWLGEMCATIRNDPTHPLRSQLTELDDINEYTAPFHHDPNTAYNADEVMAHVKRTLAIVGGC